MPDTFAKGPTLTFTKGFNVKMLAEVFDKLHLLSPYKFEPEQTIEGGILLTHWPGRRDGMYKSFQLYFPETWAWIDAKDNWRQHPSIELAAANVSIPTSLKALRGAPIWTHEELLIFRAAFECAGVKVTGIPAKKLLVAPTVRTQI